MTSPYLTDRKPPIDAVEALRVLMADLRALAGRLELKERSRSLQQTLKAAQERVSGPRAVVMLLSEHENLKRRFMERLLGPNAGRLPNPTAVCTRLEYAAEPECTVTMPQGLTAVLPLDQLEGFLQRHTTEKTMQTIRLPDPTLKDGLAVIDTPVVGSGEPQANVLECAEEADVWIFVLHPDHELSDASQELLRRLPERAARLELVVEGAEALTAETRLAARERLMRTLRERCNIESPRLTLIASAATEGDEESFWHGRFATFHSVMMRRGRERWMDATRAVVMDALSVVGTEIDFELKSVGLGLRHARLRLGMKDLDGLRTRFHELGPLDRPGTSDTKPPNADTGAEQMPALAGSPTAEMTEPVLPPLIAPPKEESAAAAPGTTSANPAPSFAQPVPPAEPAFVSFRRPVADARTQRGPSMNVSKTLARLIGHSNAGEDSKLTRPKRIAGVALAVAFVCLILWALAPRGLLFGHEAPSEWEYQPPPKQPTATHVAPAASVAPDVSLPQPGDVHSLPDTEAAETPSIPPVPHTKRHTAIRTPLLRPTPSGATAGVPPTAKRHHRHMLGLGKLWHWVRHKHSKHTPSNQ
jgi:hypothetical protein